MFLKLGFKSVTMDDIAAEMSISKKTIYRYYANKEKLIEESTESIHHEVHAIINQISGANYNAIQENFKIRRMFKEMFNSIEASPIYQLKKHYPKIYDKVLKREVSECNETFLKNIAKGKTEELYRPEVNEEVYAKFYYTLIFNINETTAFEKDAQALEIQALEYHIRAIATPKGVTELEKQLNIF